MERDCGVCGVSQIQICVAKSKNSVRLRKPKNDSARILSKRIYGVSFRTTKGQNTGVPGKMLGFCRFLRDGEVLWRTFGTCGTRWWDPGVCARVK